MSRFSVLLLVLVAATVVGSSGPSRASAAENTHPRIFQIGRRGVPGWTVAAIRQSRRESNWRAWHDSQPGSRYLYRGSRRPLGRVAGWFETLALSRGAAQAEVVVLVSLFSTVPDAERAYWVILPGTSTPVPLSIGARAVVWQTAAGVASGPHGLAGYFGGFTTIVQAGAVVVEIHADVGGRPGQVLRSPLPDPGRAIARRLARMAGSAYML